MVVGAWPSQLSQKVETLVSLLRSYKGVSGVEGPGEVLHKVDTEEFVVLDYR